MGKLLPHKFWNFDNVEQHQDSLNTPSKKEDYAESDDDDTYCALPENNDSSTTDDASDYSTKSSVGSTADEPYVHIRPTTSVTATQYTDINTVTDIATYLLPKILKDRSSTRDEVAAEKHIRFKNNASVDNIFYFNSD